MPEQPDAAHDPVLLTRDGAVATVTFNRPDAMNSLDLAMKQALLAVLREVADDADVRAVVLTGAGRAFSAGQDLREHIEGLKAGDASLGVTVTAHYNPAVTLLATMNKPVIAAINGVAAGAGASLAMAADFRIMVDSAGMNLAFAGIALSCDTGSSWHLPRLVGLAKAKELLLLPRTVRADECLALGLATQVVSAEDFPAVVTDLAQHTGGRADPLLRLASPGGALQRHPYLRGVTRLRGRADDLHRRHRRPPRGRRGVPRQARAAVPGALA